MIVSSHKTILTVAILVRNPIFKIPNPFLHCRSLISHKSTQRWMLLVTTSTKGL